ncbi:hypothetical protein IMY05_C4525000300 [Salix suchowensis]|nr:hypothetical protein IMY05_C4525000300 [Salix suchowensis]
MDGEETVASGVECGKLLSRGASVFPYKYWYDDVVMGGDLNIGRIVDLRYGQVVGRVIRAKLSNTPDKDTKSPVATWAMIEASYVKILNPLEMRASATGAPEIQNPWGPIAKSILPELSIDQLAYIHETYVEEFRSTNQSAGLVASSLIRFGTDHDMRIAGHRGYTEGTYNFLSTA